jgi:hypothetical protein
MVNSGQLSLFCNFEQWQRRICQGALGDIMCVHLFNWQHFPLQLFSAAKILYRRKKRLELSSYVIILNPCDRRK